MKATSGYTMAQNNIVAKNANCVEGEWMDVFTPDSKKVGALPSYDINWNNILQGSYDDYTGYNGSSNTNFSRLFRGETLEKVKEVGRLYLYVCCTLPMSYYGYTGTGSVSANIASILPKYWGYKNQIKVNQRRNYTKETWEQLLYEELSNERLVVYAGTAEKDDGTTGAHTFIMDGYDGAGYWHVNWGWNGKCDGYFSFDNLLPYGLPDDTDGYTVSRNGYVLHQHAITGIEPDRDNSATKNNGYLTVGYTTTKSSFTSGNTTYGRTMIAYFENPNPTITTNQVSWALLNDDGTINKTYYGNYRTVKMPKYDRQDYASNADSVEVSGKKQVRMYFAPLDRVVSTWKLTKAGTYKIVPICRKEGDTKFEDFRICEGADKYYFTVTIDAKGKASVTSHPQYKLSLKEIKVVGDQLVNHTQEIQVILKNETQDEFAGMCQLRFDSIPDEATKIGTRTASANIMPGDTVKVKFPVILDASGEYTVKASYQYRKGVYTPFSDSFTFTISSASGKTAQIHTSFNLENDVEGVNKVGERFYLTSNSLQGTFTVSNTGSAQAYRCTYVQLYSSPNVSKETLVGSARIDGNIVPGYTVNLPFHFNNLDLTPGKTYYLFTSCDNRDNGSASGGKNYQVVAAPSLTWWDKDGRETKEWIDPEYSTESSGSGWYPTYTYTYMHEVAVPTDAVAVDLSAAVGVMRKNETSSGSWQKKIYVDDYTFKPATNPNCLYFFDAQPTTEVNNLLKNKNVVVDGVAEKITLTDGFDYGTPREFTATAISYARKFDTGMKKRQGGGWQSVVLPFDVERVTIDGTEYHWFRSADDDAEFWAYAFTGEQTDATFGITDVVFSYANTLPAHTPFITAVPDASWGAANSLVGKTLTFEGNNAVVMPVAQPVVGFSHYDFVGTYATDEIDNAYVLDALGTSFVKGNATVSPFNAYLKSKTSAGSRASRIVISGDPVTTGINTLQTDDNGKNLYNLMGIKTMGAQKGIYIKNGKKAIK